MDDYLAKRGGEIKSSAPAVQGPGAKVGWMAGRWFQWQPEGKPSKWELVKIDDNGRPYVEGKGADAKHYEGPKAAEIRPQ
ncbi:hypothetical protein EON82_25355 [bacterium]|nr:MAG: hypothetical protein EON82_25355 [bacterium]